MLCCKSILKNNKRPPQKTTQPHCGGSSLKCQRSWCFSDLLAPPTNDFAARVVTLVEPGLTKDEGRIIFINYF